MGGWLGTRVRGYLGLVELRREVEATKLRVKVLEEDQKDAWQKLEQLEDASREGIPPFGHVRKVDA